MTLGDLSFIKTYLSEFTGVCPPPCVMIFDADDVATIVDHCNHFTQPQAETAFPFQYHLPQLRWGTPQYHLPQLRCGSRCHRSTGILMFFSEKLIRAISCNANGIPLGHQLFQIAMEAVGGLVSSAVAAMMFQRASVDVCTCVRRTHAMLDGLQANMGHSEHRFIFNP